MAAIPLRSKQNNKVEMDSLRTITGSNFADLMVKLKELDTRRGKLGKGVLLLHDSASSTLPPLQSETADSNF